MVAVKIKVVKERNNPVMKRKDLVLEVDYGGGPTPPKEEVRKAVSAELSVEPERVEVEKILSHSGKASGRAWVKIWDEKKVPVEKDEKTSGEE